MNKQESPSLKFIPENSKPATTYLKDSLGKVFFYVPARFDTSFRWTNISDCGKSCNYEQYRFQPKTLPIFQETGFYYISPDISLDQFTILHSGYFPFHEGDTSKNVARHEFHKARISSDPDYGTTSSDTIEKIYDRYYSILYTQGFDKKKRKNFATVSALTTIKGNEIEFRYEIRTENLINLEEFNRNSTRFLRTIRISNGI